MRGLTVRSVLAGLAMAAIAGVAAAQAPAAHRIYGIELGDGPHRVVWRLDVDTGVSEFVAALPAVEGDTFYPNGLALDRETDRLYYWTRAGGAPEDRFIAWIDLHDPLAGQHIAGDLPLELVASGGMYGGQFYYVATEIAGPNAGDTKLVRLSFDRATGNLTGTENLLYDVLPGYGDLGFGDVAVDQSTGVLYASAHSLDLDTGVFFRCEPDAAGQWGCTPLCDDATPGCAGLMQLAFSGGTLYAKAATGDSRFYTIDLATGTVSGLADQGPDVTDLADSRTECATDLIVGRTHDDDEGDDDHGDDDHGDDDHGDDDHERAGLELGVAGAGRAAVTAASLDGDDEDGGGERAGSVSVTLAASGQYEVTYRTGGGWELREIHFHAACDPEGFPQTRSGNPKIGQFDYVFEGLSGTSFSFTIASAECDGCIYYAAHAVVADAEGSETAWGAGEDFGGASWAMYFTCGTCDDDHGDGDGDDGQGDDGGHGGDDGDGDGGGGGHGGGGGEGGGTHADGDHHSRGGTPRPRR